MTTRQYAKILLTVMAFALCCAWTASSWAADLTAEKEKAEKEKTAKATGEPAKPVPPDQKDITDAVNKFKERDFDGALKILKAAAKKNPDLPPAQVIMAQLFSQANVGMGIRNSLEQAVIDAPNDPEAYVIMGDLALRDRRWTEARMLYQKANDLMGSFKGSSKRKDLLLPRIFGGLASIDEVQDKWGEAQKLLEAWLKVDPKNPTAIQRVASCLFHQKDPEGALKRLKEAAKMDPDALTPEAVLALFYEQAGDRQNAGKWMNTALQVAPKDLKTHLVAGQWAFETNQVPEAEAQAAAALKIDPKSLDAKILSGVIALFKRDYPAAERYFEAAHLQAPRNFAATNNLALVLIEQKDEAKRRRALDYAQSNVQQNPKSSEAASTYGWVLYKLGRFDEAEKALQVAVSGGTFGPDTAYYLACLYYDRGRETQAKQWLDFALKTSGPFAMRKDALALLEKLKK